MDRRIIKTSKRSNCKERRERLKHLEKEGGQIDSRIAMIQMLIPLGLKAVEEQLQGEVERLAGARYGRENPDQENKAWHPTRKRGGGLWMHWILQ